MTTIAYRDGVVWADSQCTGSSGAISRVRKLVRLDDGSVLAGAGSVVAIAAIREWAAKGFKGKRPPKTANCECLLIKPDRTLWYLDGAGQPFEIVDEYTAIGSGSSFAEGAMAHGATAQEAVECAAKHDSCSSGPFYCETL